MSQTTDTQEKTAQWSDQDIEAVMQPFDDQVVDQFTATMAERGYPIKTAEELEAMLPAAIRLQEKIASGQMASPRANKTPSTLSRLTEKVAAQLGKDNTVEEQKRKAHIQQKVAASVSDPFVLYASLALDALQNNQG